MKKSKTIKLKKKNIFPGFQPYPNNKNGSFDPWIIAYIRCECGEFFTTEEYTLSGVATIIHPDRKVCRLLFMPKSTTQNISNYDLLVTEITRKNAKTI